MLIGASCRRLNCLSPSLAHAGSRPALGIPPTVKQRRRPNVSRCVHWRAPAQSRSRPHSSLQRARPPAPEPSAVSLYRHWNDAARRRKAPRGAGDRRVTGKAAKDGCPKPAKAVPFVAWSVPTMVAGMRRHEREQQHGDGRGISNKSVHELTSHSARPRIPEVWECVGTGRVPQRRPEPRKHGKDAVAARLQHAAKCPPPGIRNTIFRCSVTPPPQPDTVFVPGSGVVAPE